MPLSFRQLQNTFVAGPNISIYPSGNTYVISGNATSLGGGFTGLTSAGTGQYLIASSVTNNNLIYKTLSGSSNLGIIDNGLGLLIFTAVTSSGGSTIISGTNVGTGTNVFCGLTTTVSSNDTMQFANLSGSTDFSVSLNDNSEIFVDRGSIVATSFRNEGGGARVLSTISSDFRSLSGRTISGSNGFTVVTAGTVVNISPTNTTGSRLYISDSTNTLTSNGNFNYATFGNIAIGSAGVLTTRLNIAAGSATQSQIRLTKSSFDVSSPTDGDIWYITTGSTLKFYKGDIKTDFLFKDNNNFLTGTSNTKLLLIDSGGTINTKNISIFGVFNTISSLTLSNTASETSIISSQLVTGNTKILLSTNNLTNPQLIVGKKFRFNAKGTIETTGSVNLTLKMKLDNSIIANTGTLALTTSIPASTYFEVDTTFTVRTTGSTGTVIGSGKIISDTNLVNGISSEITNIATQGEVTIDTTSDKIFDITAQFGTASANNKIVIYEATLEYLN